MRSPISRGSRRGALITCVFALGLALAGCSLGTGTSTEPGTSPLSSTAAGSSASATAVIPLSTSGALAALPGTGGLGSNAQEATQRLANGSFGTYGLDCSEYGEARLTVQGGANGISLSGFQYWIYSVDYGQYVLSGAYIPMEPGWTTKSFVIVAIPGRYQVHVKYWSQTGGLWYHSAGEWAYAKNLLQPTTSFTCHVL